MDMRGHHVPSTQKTVLKTRLMCWAGTALAALHTAVQTNNNSYTTITSQLGSLPPSWPLCSPNISQRGPAKLKLDHVTLLLQSPVGSISVE